jgi:hypothetical protein
MKRNVFLKAYLTNGLALILVLFLSNCQVEEDTLQGNNQTASVIYKAKIEDYWGQLKTGSTKEQLSKIEELSTAIDINSLKIYDLRTTEKLVIANVKSLQGLDGIIKIIFYLNENKVVRSNIVTLKTNEANSDYNKVIQSVLNADKKGFNYTGEITFLSLSKTKLLFDKFNQGDLVENKTLSSSRNRKKFSKTQGNCTEYWWVTKYGNEIISQVYLFTVCDCSGGGGPNGGDETFKMSNCDNGAGVFLGGSSASTSTNKPTLPANPINNQTYKFTDPDGVCTEYKYNSSINSWEILEVILPNIIISRNKDNYGILDFQWPVDNQKVFDQSTNLLYTYEGGSDSWSGVPTTAPEAIEKQIDNTQLDPCPKGVMEQLKKATNCDIANVLEKLGAEKGIIVTMKSETPANGDTGQTTRTNPGVRYDYTIKITQDNTSATQLFKAHAILHELVHAFFMSLKDDYNTSGSPAVYTEFSELFKVYVEKNKPGAGDLDHAQMAKVYVNAIGSALQEFQTGIPVAYETIPDQVYTDLAWYGIRDIKAYSDQPEADRTRMENRYRAENNGSYYQGQSAIGKPCN